MLLFEQLGSSIPVPFLIVLAFWLTRHLRELWALRSSKRNRNRRLLRLCLSVSGAIFLILELDRSFEGMLQVSSTPLRTALDQLNR